MKFRRSVQARKSDEALRDILDQEKMRASIAEIFGPLTVGNESAVRPEDIFSRSDLAEVLPFPQNLDTKTSESPYDYETEITFLNSAEVTPRGKSTPSASIVNLIQGL